MLSIDGNSSSKYLGAMPIETIADFLISNSLEVEIHLERL